MAAQKYGPPDVGMALTISAIDKPTKKVKKETKEEDKVSRTSFDSLFDDYLSEPESFGLSELDSEPELDAEEERRLARKKTVAGWWAKRYNWEVDNFKANAKAREAREQKEAEIAAVLAKRKKAPNTKGEDEKAKWMEAHARALLQSWFWKNNVLITKDDIQDPVKLMFAFQEMDDPPPLMVLKRMQENQEVARRCEPWEFSSMLLIKTLYARHIFNTAYDIREELTKDFERLNIFKEELTDNPTAGHDAGATGVKPVSED